MVLRFRALLATIAITTTIVLLAMPQAIEGQNRGALVRGRVELPRMPGIIERRPAAAEIDNGLGALIANPKNRCSPRGSSNA